MSTLRLGLLSYPVTAPGSLAEFAAKLDHWLEQGRQAADFLVLPEYACVEIAAAFGAAGEVGAELRAVCDAAEALLAIFVKAAQRHKIWLLPGTMPWPDADRIRNRAPLIAPDGQLAFQDKSVMTRFENESWHVAPGDPPKVFATPWGVVGIAICYDIEFPNLVRAQAEAGARLILVPSCTDTLHGFYRVQLSARARALENQCFVAMAPTVGECPALATLDCNRGAAGVFSPVDRGFEADGVVVEGQRDKPGWVFAELDLNSIEQARQNGQVRNFRDWVSACPPAGLVSRPA